MSDSPIPAATYRLQFNRNFRFADATALLDYFAALGITDIYASPILASRKGSLHGYDVIDPTQIDPDIGTPQEFAQFQEGLIARGMRLILDIVPNHMAASSENRWWMDVLENGAESRFASYFDIDWHPPSRALDGKVLLPILGRPAGEVLDRGELRLVFQNGRLFVRYFDSALPLAPASYHRLLSQRTDELKKSLSEDSPVFQEYSGIVTGLASFASPAGIAAEAAAERRVRFDALVERLQALLAANPEIAAFIENSLADFNGAPGDPASMCDLEHLLNEQKFRLAYWLDPNEAINYRRFFAISDLVGIRVEDPVVFEATHDQILRLAAGPAIRGFRVDHIDGLRDPLAYLKRLEEKSVAPAASYVLVEKILAPEECLPGDWPVSGTTGYEYLNIANGPFVCPSGAAKLTASYHEFLGKQPVWPDVVYEKKKLVMNTLLRVEMRSLARQFIDLAANDRYARELLRQELMEVLTEVTACVPVYRTYIRNLDVPPAAKIVIERAIDDARARRPQLSHACFAFLRDVLTLANPPHILADQREQRLAFAMRWQQFTGPIVAKGFEDTALYVYYPLLSLNEVGGNPEPSQAPSRQDFFQFIEARKSRWAGSLNATTTHDTKRSEDIRARLNVLSEIPDEWASNLSAWSRENEPLKQVAGHRKVPDANEEYLIYQTLLGMWPHDSKDFPAICERLQAYVIKAIREASVHTRWTEPNVAHETAISNFIQRIVLDEESSKFRCSIASFQKRIAYPGMVNALGQALLKIASPGVPDFYQGSELWDYRLVDPDNRTPVDFRARADALRSLVSSAESNPAEIAANLLKDWPDGKLKLYVIWKALVHRRTHPLLYAEGAFLPLKVEGPRAQHVIAFQREHGPDRTVVVIPRWIAGIPAPADESTVIDFWKGTNLALPAPSPKLWRNIFTANSTETLDESGDYSLSVGKLLARFPVALLAAMYE